MDYTEHILHTLTRVCRYPWFSAEFRAAGGFEWLIEKFPDTKKDQAAAIICLSLDYVEDEADVVSWLQEFYDLLISYNSIGGFQEPEIFVEAVERIVLSQRQHRENLQSDSAMVSHTPAHTVRDAAHAYVLDWSEVKWNYWSHMVKEISGGVRRGYIRIGPSEYTSRFVRDPDGFCSR
jgi:hypothetical protein